MSFIGLIIAIAVLGFIVYLILLILPMPQPFRQIIIALAALIALLLILSAFGFIGGPNMKFPLIR